MDPKRRSDHAFGRLLLMACLRSLRARQVAEKRIRACATGFVLQAVVRNSGNLKEFEIRRRPAEHQVLPKLPFEADGVASLRGRAGPVVI